MGTIVVKSRNRSHSCAVPFATQRGRPKRLQYRHPPRAQPVAPHAGASLQRSTAAPEALHRSGPLARSGTTRWRAREEQQPHRLTMPRDALPTRLSSFCLLAMASPPRDPRRDPWISQQTSGIVSGANSKCIAGALATFLLTAGRVARRSSPRQSRRPGRERLTIPRDALPTRLSSFCLLAMASPPRDTRRNPLISQHTSGIVSGADSRFIDRCACCLSPYSVSGSKEK